MIGRRRVLLALGAVPWLGCKRNRAPAVQEVWDDEPVPAMAEALGALAPPWPAPVRGQLDNGLITFWLHEPDGTAMHVRLLVPTAALDEAPPGEAVAVAAEHARFDWQRRVQKLGVTVTVRHEGGRFEVAASGEGGHLFAVLAALRQMLGTHAPAGIDGARTRTLERASGRSSLDLAAAATTARLLGVDDSVDPARLADTSRSELHEHWHRMVDPRGVVLLVHSGTTAEAAKAELRKLSEAWRVTTKRRFAEQATARLHRRGAAEGTGTRLLSAPVTPLVVAPGPAKGSATLVLGRTIALNSAKDRGMARLAQRVAQEEFDASVAIGGNLAVWLVATSLGRSAPDRDIQRAVEQLAGFAQTRQPRQRLFQAAQLWLGARVVEASLGGEDWTALFAQAIDLAGSDAEIAGALAHDAKIQLAVDPAELATWTTRWLDPRAGEPGWAWSAAGIDDAVRQRIARVVQVR